MQDDVRLGVRAEGEERDQLVEELRLAHGTSVRTRLGSVETQYVGTLQPANSADRGRELSGAVHDLRSSSATVVLSTPIDVGSFFRLELAGETGDLPTTFARCDRVTMLGETRFECRLQFVQPIELPEGSRPASQ